MRINTKAYGPTDIDERQTMYFPGGIIGFEQFKRYALLDAAQQPFTGCNPSMWWKSLSY